MRFGLLAAAAAMIVAAPASAAVRDLTIDVNFTNFRPGAPVDPVVGTFRFVFDDAVTFDATSAGLTITGFNLPTVKPIQFAYSASLDNLSVGTDVSPDGASNADPLDFSFFIGGIKTGERIVTSEITYADVNGTRYQSGEFMPPLPSVPEPATWAMMIAGVATAGASLRRRRRVLAPAL